MIHKLPIQEFLQQAKSYPLLDVRAPLEFTQGHIPGAYNLFLFDNEERAEIGTLYKQAGREAAIKRGLDIVGPKMSGFVQEVEKMHQGKNICVHCWRGGMRSGFMAWLFDLFGYDVYLLQGGYKSFRRQVLDAFQQEYPFKIISGYTGSGKTAILQQLAALGEQSIDLEALANHKGSAFGHIGMPAQGSNEQFENDIFYQLNNLDPQRCIWLEDESKSIGKLYIPRALHAQMTRASTFFVHIPFEPRWERLMEDYGKKNRQDLRAAAMKIERRMGPQHLKLALQFLEEGNIGDFIRVCLAYYDKTYLHSMERKPKEPAVQLNFETFDAELIAKALIKAERENTSYGN
jgi:tRNA 2-selenouridine synthase